MVNKTLDHLGDFNITFTVALMNNQIQSPKWNTPC